MQEISIHLMFLLISNVTVALVSPFYFNTSHVSINLLGTGITSLTEENFNTSHVSINRFKTAVDKAFDSHFNTSHVSINRLVGEYISRA